MGFQKGARNLCLACLLLLSACGGPSSSPALKAGHTGAGAPAYDARFITDLPDGPITPPQETAESAKALAEAKALGDQGAASETVVAAFIKAAQLGSPEARFWRGMMLANGAEGPENRGGGFDIILDLAKQGHAPAAIYISALSAKSDSPILNQHTPYFQNIARRAGSMAALADYQSILAAMRTDGRLPPGTGTGDYFDSAISFSQPLTNSAEGVPLEYKVAAQLFPGWRRISQSLLSPMNGKSFDVLELENDTGQRVKLYFDITSWFGMGKTG